MAESDQYAVRCEVCETSFAPETKTCVHCGGALGGGLLSALRSEDPNFQGADVDEPEEAGSRLGGGLQWIGYVVFIVGMALIRGCE